MTEPLVCQLLRDGMTYEELYEKHAVEAKPYNGKVSLTYDMIAAKDTDPVACQCRGLVLSQDSFDVLAWPFNRFFNHGQGAAATIDWNTARFENKLDGTLLIVYYWGMSNSWLCATRSMAEAHGICYDENYSFAQLAQMAVKEHGFDTLHDMMRNADQSCTYMMELTSPYNQIVCQYEKPQLHLLGVRDLKTGQELDPEPVAEKLGIHKPQTWHFNNLDHLMEVVRDWSPKNYEGIVVKDGNFNRIKVKSPQYHAVAHISESASASWRGCVELILGGNDDDILPLLPIKAKERIEMIKPLLQQLILDTEADYNRICHIDNMKAFANEAVTCRWDSALFAVKRKKSPSIKEFIRNSRADVIVDKLKLK